MTEIQNLIIVLHVPSDQSGIFAFLPKIIFKIKLNFKSNFILQVCTSISFVLKGDKVNKFSTVNLHNYGIVVLGWTRINSHAHTGFCSNL